MNVLMLSPGYPSEMPRFAGGLRAVGATVIGMGDTPGSGLPAPAREALADYHQVRCFADEDAVVRDAVAIAGRVRIERVACLWEPLMVMAARIRERLGLPGMTVEETVPFRDKETMKQVLDRAGIRTPRHARADRVDQVLEAAERIGYPLIVKPIAGAGSADTHRVDDRAGLDAVLRRVRHVHEVSVEEFIEGEEFTFDTVCANGQMVFYNICSYRPRPLIARQLEWISPQTVALRNPDVPYLAAGRRLGEAVLKAMNFRTGFTHMEWHLKADGEAVFGEIAARPPGAFTVDIMNYASDLDLFRGWAEAELHGRFTQPIERRYNCASIFKRAQGQGRIQRLEGVGELMADFGPHVVNVDLLPVGAQRRDWLQTLISDGMVIVRHPDLTATLHMADRVGTDLRLIAG
ncbi:MAG: ATP-grasp domain-containing protein [Candidatus Eiseniibacteriota bacterium]